MRDGCNIFSKKILDIKQVIEILKLDSKDIMLVKDIDNWVNMKNEIN